MSKSKNKTICFILLLNLFLFTSLPAKAQMDFPNYNEPIELEGFQITKNKENETAEVKSTCGQGDIKNFEKINECYAVCDECAYRDDGCWYCVDDKEKETIIKKTWNKIKNFFNKIIAAVAKLFNINVQQPKKKAEKKEQKINKDHEIAAQKVLEYYKESQSKSSKAIFEKENQEEKKKQQEIENSLKKAIESARSLAELLKIQSLISIYCDTKAKKDYKKLFACEEKFMKEFKKRGDILKEKLINDIDPEKATPETYQKIISLEALLMAGQNAKGEGEWFSTENIKKVMAQLKEKAKKWFQNALRKMKLEDLASWYALAEAHSDILGKGNQLFEGSNPIAMFSARARLLVLRFLAGMDVCNPDPEKLKYLQELLKYTPSCEKLLGDKEICQRIMSGNLESAYARLYKSCQKNEGTKNETKNIPKPIDCKKKKSPTTGTQPAETGQTTQPPAQESTEQIQKPTAEKDEEKQPQTSAEDQTEKTATEDQTTETLPEEQPPQTPPEEEPQSDTEEPPTEPEPEPEPEYTCNINYWPADIIGWNYSVSNCAGNYYDAMTCFVSCGWDPPLVIAEETPEGEYFCYETINGFVDYNTIIPCHERPMPDPGTIQCVQDCLLTP